jgi:hypothetical protein
MLIVRLPVSGHPGWRAAIVPKLERREIGARRHLHMNGSTQYKAEESSR